MSASTLRSHSDSTSLAARHNTVARSLRAELYRLRSWPAMWTTVGTWFLLAMVFGYVFPYVSYTTGTAGFSTEGEPTEALLQSALPESIPDILVQGTPLFGGALVLVLGALIAGNGYSWGTWKTVFTHGRLRPTIGALLALAVIVAAMVVVTAVLCTVVSVSLATIETQPLTMPSAGALLRSAGAAYLVFMMWGTIGFALGTYARSAALSVGLGLVWTVVVENLLRGVGSALHLVEDVTAFLSGTAAGSFVGAVTGGGEGTPGVVDVISGPRALITVAAYIAVAVVATGILVRSRDVN
ncbi:ABC transporter permease [Rhodococcus sp. 2G]|uniref:ABC transporter permease n=2 Tax=Nocardiaceae TaxID=85025 RepID=UPI000903D1F2|nr:ABC transporter permease [Rhodococcus sp. 2G]APE09195.1 ABC transporter permease [Rhodococcus sp. 2G]